MAKPGDVVILDFEGAMGTKRRPAVVVSSDIYHRTRPDVIVAVLTSQIASASAPSDYVLSDWQAAGLTKPTAFRAYLATTPSSKVNVIGRLSARDWAAVQERLAVALALKP